MTNVEIDRDALLTKQAQEATGADVMPCRFVDSRGCNIRFSIQHGRIGFEVPDYFVGFNEVISALMSRTAGIMGMSDKMCSARELARAVESSGFAEANRERFIMANRLSVWPEKSRQWALKEMEDAGVPTACLDGYILASEARGLKCETSWPMKVVVIPYGTKQEDLVETLASSVRIIERAVGACE